MITVEARYQRWGKDGLTWSNWYVHKRYETREEAEKALPSFTTTINKLKIEYRIV